MFNPLAARAVEEAINAAPIAHSVVELGNQRLDPSLPGGDTKGFYRLRGVSRYLALDVNNRMDAVVADLNDVEKTLTAVGDERFDIVTNNGTGEHVFDQRAVFEICHELARPLGGIIVHVLPMLPWLNHGFYNYTPVLFRDLQAANSYRMLFLWVGDRWGNYEDCRDMDGIYKEKNPAELQRVVQRKHWRGDLFLAVGFQRQLADKFTVPLQGKYVKDVESAELARQYSRQSD